jgi:hypothetical protein
MSTPTFFATPADWRAWLETHHATAAEISVGFWKRETGKPSITWPQSVDEALASGDRRGAQPHRRRGLPHPLHAPAAGSVWSQVN